MHKRVSITISTFFVLLIVILWHMSYNHRAGIYYFRYFTHIEDQTYLMNAIEINDGDILVHRTYSSCMTEEKKSRGINNGWEDMAMERRGEDLPNTLSKIYIRSSTPIRYVGDTDGFWESLGFRSGWILGYRNWTWSQKIFMPFWPLFVVFSIYPFIMTVSASVQMMRIRTKRNSQQ